MQGITALKIPGHGSLSGCKSQTEGDLVQSLSDLFLRAPTALRWNPDELPSGSAKPQLGVQRTLLSHGVDPLSGEVLHN